MKDFLFKILNVMFDINDKINKFTLPYRQWLSKHGDKVQHFALALLLMVIFAPFIGSLQFGIMLMILLGVKECMFDANSPTRSADLWDWIAAVIPIIIYIVIDYTR